jgi:hypothetical protein
MGLSAMGLVVAVCLISVHTASPVAMVNFPEVASDGSPIHPPISDHIMWGVGNEDRIERRANWALKVIGKMNGTALEAMIANGTIGSEAEVVDPALVAEIHQAMDEQNREVDLNAPASEAFPFEAAQAAAGGDEEEGAEGEEDEEAEEGDEGDEAADEEGGEEDADAGAEEGGEEDAEGGEEEPAAEEGEEPAAEEGDEPAAEEGDEPAAEEEEEPAGEEGAAAEEEPAADGEEPAE